MSNLQQTLRRNCLWLFYIVFLVLAFYTHDGEPYFTSVGAYGAGKLVCWIIFLAFLAYTLHVNARENFFKSLGRMNNILWSRQVGLDLYIGLLLPLFLIFLNEGSLLVMLLWLLPIFFFANLATLVYLALNYDSLIAHFVL